MSYARFGSNDSNVYVFASTGGGIDCCGCWLIEELADTYKANTSGEMITHLNEHRGKGHIVPDYTYAEIVEDYPDLEAVISAD